MEWNVYYERNGVLKKFNVFDHQSFREDVFEALQSNLSFWELSDKVRQIAKYYFKSKCEYEVLIADWPCERVLEKISVYDQLSLNWERFIDYIYN